MTSADFLRFVIIVSLGVLGFITFLVAGTIIGLMWLDAWSCGVCKEYPAGIYILGLLGILFIISIGVEASEAPSVVSATWWPWLKKSRTPLAMGLAVAALSLFTIIIAMNSRWWF
jgi:hypothetical protein